VDRIHIRDLRLRCIIGIDDDERREKQDVTLQVTMHADLRDACRTDEFARTVDYRAAKKRIVKLVEASRYLLLEALAEAVARTCLEDVRVERVDVQVEKPGALRFARTVVVDISRARTEA
jgi:D-erythro-7,8-dihydroneopterin triphosphate epimerase